MADPNEQIQEVTPEEEKTTAKTKQAEVKQQKDTSKPAEKEEWSSAESYAEQVMSQKTEKKDVFDDMEEEHAKVGEEIEAMATNEEGTQMKAADMYSVSLAIVEVLDAFNSGAARAVAGEKSSKDFEMESGQTKRLAKSLAFALYKSQVKFGPWTAVIILAVLYFGGPWKLAHEKRKENKLKEKELSLKSKTKEKTKQEKIQKFDRIVLSRLEEEGQKTVKQLESLTDNSNAVVRASLKRLIIAKKVKQIKSNNHREPTIYKIIK